MVEMQIPFRREMDPVRGVSVAYGIDLGTGLFLSVTGLRANDDRLKAGDDEPLTVKKALAGYEYDQCEDDGSWCFNLHTGPGGFGAPASKSTVMVYLQRFGVPEADIQQMDVLHVDERWSGKQQYKQPLQTEVRDKKVPTKMEDTKKPTKMEDTKKPTKTEDKKVPTEMNKVPAQSEQQQQSVTASVTSSTASNVPLANPGPGKCVQCGKQAHMRCVRCRDVGQAVHYCSKECQQADWAKHKHFCALNVPEKKMKPNFDKFNFTKPSVLAFLFEANATKPKVVEVPIKVCFVGEPCENPELPPLQGPYASYGHIFMSRNPQKEPGTHGHQVENVLLFKFHDNFANDGSAPNRCIRTIAGTTAVPHPWAGPVWGFKCMENRVLPANTFTDVQLADGSTMIDFFKSYGGGQSV